MQKLGRNDPCHCGSGKKYKKCCLEKDEASNVTRLVPTGYAAAATVEDWEEEEDEHGRLPDNNDWGDFGPDEVQSMVEEKLPWANALYQMLARHLVNRMAGRYDWSVISQAVILLYAYTADEQPLTRKAGVLPAAAEYVAANMINGYNVTQTELAEIYNVSVATISKKAQEMLDFAEAHSDKFAQAFAPDEELSANSLEQERMGMEQTMRSMTRSISDVESGIAGESHPKREEAVGLLYRAWQEPSRKKRSELARKALSLYPDAADAYNILAETDSRSLEQIADYYRRGMLAGERDLGRAYFQDNRGYFWGLVETRPYMRAKFGYAEASLYLGKTLEAIRQLEDLLELNPHDNQGARDLLAVAYLQKKRYREALALIDRYGENAAAAHYDRLLIEYSLNGMTAKLSKLYRNAKRSNPHVLPYLLGKKPVPEAPPAYIRLGEDSEAIDYVVTRYELWNREKRLLGWLAAQTAQ
jgi:tetratricopeptide (TPR) repeat protein